MDSLSLTDALTIDPGVRFRRVFDEAVMIHPDHSEALLLNDTAARRAIRDRSAFDTQLYEHYAARLERGLGMVDAPFRAVLRDFAAERRGAQRRRCHAHLVAQAEALEVRAGADEERDLGLVPP